MSERERTLEPRYDRIRRRVVEPIVAVFFGALGLIRLAQGDSVDAAIYFGLAVFAPTMRAISRIVRNKLQGRVPHVAIVLNEDSGRALNRGADALRIHFPDSEPEIDSAALRVKSIVEHPSWFSAGQAVVVAIQERKEGSTVHVSIEMDPHPFSMAKQKAYVTEIAALIESGPSRPRETVE